MISLNFNMQGPNSVTNTGFERLIGSSAQVPSGYFLTDVFLYLDMLFQGQLLKETADMSKSGQASDEAVKLKKLIGGIRGLWRSSDTGHHPRVTELKALLEPSPSKKKELELMES